MKKCPPGVICIENFTLFFVIICFILLFYILYTGTFKQKIQVNNNEKIVIKDQPRENNGWFGGFIPSFPYSNLPGDVLLNPYVPPLRDERYLIPELSFAPPRSLPINVSTSAVDTAYRQVGILTPLNGKGKILPLMGRPLFTRRDLWQYYTMSDSNNSMKLPISVGGKSATNEYGVDKIYGGTSVYVEGYNQAFKATIYDNDTIKYIPFI
jgi:hypothetical protein